MCYGLAQDPRQWHLRRGTLTKQFKLQASSNAEEHGSRASAREFKINESMVREWGKQETELRQVKKTKLSFRRKNYELSFVKTSSHVFTFPKMSPLC